MRKDCKETRVNRPIPELLLLGLGAFALSGCQPSLRSELPAGMAGYQALQLPDAVAFPSTYALRPGDTVAIRVYQEAELSVDSVLLDEAGNITVPLIGQVHAEGQTSDSLAQQIEQVYGSRFLRNPSVSVTLVQAVPRYFSVEGEVKTPGVYTFRPGFTLLAAMSSAGSPSRTARLDEVLVFRTIDGQRVGARFDLTEVRAGRMPDPTILPGDVVVVGFSSVRGAYQDFLQLAPIFGIFTRF